MSIFAKRNFYKTLLNAKPFDFEIHQKTLDNLMFHRTDVFYGNIRITLCRLMDNKPKAYYAEAYEYDESLFVFRGRRARKLYEHFNSGR